MQLVLVIPAHSESWAQVVQTPYGPVEFIGLRRWTVQMIRDTMAVKAPGMPLGQCAAILRSIGFPSADARTIVIDGVRSDIVVVVEPDDSNQVRLRPMPTDSLADLLEWHVLTSLARRGGTTIQSIVLSYAPREAGDTAAVRFALRVTHQTEQQLEPAWRFLQEHRTEADLQKALWIADNDGNVANQIAALAILENFGDRDLVWWTLMDLQRDSKGVVSAVSSQVLAALSSAKSRPVNWAPAVSSIRSILQGTNVALFGETLGILRRTQLSRDLAPAILSLGAKKMLLAHLAAQSPYPRQSARDFLVYLAGRDLGDDPAAWARWMDSVH